MYGEHLILPIEIESCSSRDSFKNTICKSVLGLIDTIRHYKRFMLGSVHEWTGFAFPKFKKASVVKVVVKFDMHSFHFEYTLN